MNSKQHRSITLDGSFTLALSTVQAFPLFSPEGERAWADGWEPEVLHPQGGDWSVGQVFRTQDGGREVVWVVTDLNHESGSVTYHRVEGRDLVARVSVRCEQEGEAETRVSVSYADFSLSDAGDDEITGMSEAAYADKMRNWKQQIEARVT